MAQFKLQILGSKGLSIDVEFKRIMRIEVENVWIKDKVCLLVYRYLPNNVNDNIRDVIMANFLLVLMNT